MAPRTCQTCGEPLGRDKAGRPKPGKFCSACRPRRCRSCGRLRGPGQFQRPYGYCDVCKDVAARKRARRDADRAAVEALDPWQREIRAAELREARMLRREGLA